MSLNRNRNKFSELEASMKEEVLLYVGESEKAKYRERWESMDRRNSKLSWNWAAAIWIPGWAIYRKMYSLGIIYLLIIIVFNSFISNSTSVGMGFAMAMFANQFYLDHAIKEVKRIREEIPDEWERREYLSEHGGGNSKALWILIAAFILYVLIA